MDEDLRDLKRRASNDPQAAIAYYLALKRKGILIQPQTVLPPQTIELHARGIRGLADLHPVSGTEIVITSHTVDRQAQNVTINRVNYHIRGRYYFYPELGWVPYDPEIISHAQGHVNRVIEWGQRSDSDTQEETRTRIQYWLPRSSMESGHCFSCGESNPQVVHLTLRGDNGRRGTTTAYDLLDAHLRRILPEWAAEHQEIMRIAQLNEIQRHKKSVDEKLTELYDKVTTLQQQMVELISEEIQLD